MLIDSHCHLYQIPDVASSVGRASESGVQRIVVVSEDLASMEKAMNLSRCYDEVMVGLGLHPALVNGMPPEAIDAGMAFIRSHLDEVDMLGEAGLDFKVAKQPEEQALQRSVLNQQFELAAEKRKPVNLHSRRALRETLEEGFRFHEKTGLNVQMHWFTQSKKLVKKACEAGIFISVGPAVLHRSETQEVVKTIADDLLLLETDSPVPFGDERSEPAWITRVAQRVAEVRDVDFETIERQTEVNFERYLGKRI